MTGARTRGHPAALAAVAAMVRGRAPHAVLLVGPAGIGKTTLALDLAAGLLCGHPDPSARPCGACRACRLVTGGVHPDVHRLTPHGPGRQVVIGGPGKARGVRDLIADLALLPVEGGARIAIVEGADRMNEDAQAALLKTLEEPPPGVTIVLCADAEEPLAPTIRSRCARLRLGPVGTRDIETILTELDACDAPTAARVARIAGGRPGLALAWATDPDALLVRDELARTLLDLVQTRPSGRLAGVRAAAGRAARLTTLGAAERGPAGAGATAPRAGRTRRGAGAQPAPAEIPTDDPGAAEPGEPAEAEGPVRTPAAERRKAAEALLGVWSDLVRDGVLVAVGRPGSVRDPRLLDDLQARADRLDRDRLTAFLERLGRAAVLVRGNVAPELVLDDLAVAWGRVAPDRAARSGRSAA